MGDVEILPKDPTWIMLRDRVVALMGSLGSQYQYPDFYGDWYLLDEDTGQQMVKIELVNNDLLRPSVVKSLQSILTGCPEWVIALQVDGTDETGKQRGMGLWIREDKVYDQLQREYLPAVFHDMHF
jgi:hypothetical protein